MRFQRLGVRLGCTRSLASAIMAPSLNTASSTTSSVGKYLRADVAPGGHTCQLAAYGKWWEGHCAMSGMRLRQSTFQQCQMSMSGLWTWELAGEEGEGLPLQKCIKGLHFGSLASTAP